MKRLTVGLLSAACVLTPIAHADPPPKPAVVPQEFQWVRTLDLEGYAQRENEHGTGVQHFQLGLRYLDPDVNAFVGMQAQADRFNRDIALGDPADPKTGQYLWTMGANIGVKNEKRRWELELMGVSAAGKLGPALAVIGERNFGRRWSYVLRLQGDFFVGDMIFDADQELCWKAGKVWGVTAGYRWFTSQHFDRSGPHIGLRYMFDSPKIPFIFPSLG